MSAIFFRRGPVARVVGDALRHLVGEREHLLHGAVGVDAREHARRQLDADDRADISHHRQQRHRQAALSRSRIHRHAHQRLAVEVAVRRVAGVVVMYSRICSVVMSSNSTLGRRPRRASSASALRCLLRASALRARSASSSACELRCWRRRSCASAMYSIGVFFISRPPWPEVLQLLAVDRGERLDRVDVERAQLGAPRLGEERRVVERRAALGLLRVRLELLVLPAEPLGVGDLDLLAGVRVGRPVRERGRREHARRRASRESGSRRSRCRRRSAGPLPRSCASFCTAWFLNSATRDASGSCGSIAIGSFSV